FNFDDTPQQVSRQGRGSVNRDICTSEVPPANDGEVCMTRLLTVLILGACVLNLSASPQQPICRDQSASGRVFVIETDHDGRLIAPLEQKDFEVRDEDKPQPITLFDNTP